MRLSLCSFRSFSSFSWVSLLVSHVTSTATLRFTSDITTKRLSGTSSTSAVLQFLTLKSMLDQGLGLGVVWMPTSARTRTRTRTRTSSRFVFRQCLLFISYISNLYIHISTEKLQTLYEYITEASHLPVPIFPTSPLTQLSSPPLPPPSSSFPHIS